MWMNDLMEKLAAEGDGFKTELESSSKITAEESDTETEDAELQRKESGVMEFLDFEKAAAGGLGKALSWAFPTFRKALGRGIAKAPSAADLVKLNPSNSARTLERLQRAAKGVQHGAMKDSLKVLGLGTALGTGVGAVNYAANQYADDVNKTLQRGTKPLIQPQTAGTPDASGSSLRDLLVYGGIPLAGYAAYKALTPDDKDEEKERQSARRRSPRGRSAAAY